METIAFEPMSVGRIFDRAFVIYRNNFVRFVTIVALIQVPLGLLTIAAGSWAETRTAHQPTLFERVMNRPQTRSAARPNEMSNARAEEPNLLALFGKLFARLLEIVGVVLCQAALIKSVSESYLGHEITVGQAYRFILPRAGTLGGAALAVGLVTGLGFILCIVPGIIFSLWFSLTTPAIVMEGHGAGAGMTRSKALVAGNLDKVLIVGFLGTLMMLVLVYSLGFLGGMIAGWVAPGNATFLTLLSDLATTIGQILIMPVTAGASILLYYDLRIRKEGFDLQMLAQSMMAEPGEARAS